MELREQEQPRPPSPVAPVSGGASGAIVEGQVRPAVPSLRRALLLARLRWAWPALALLAAYVVPLLIVRPTLRLALIDDWNYQLSVRHLVDNHELWVAPWTAATLVGQIFWGALFAWPFGVGPIPLRFSTLVASFGGTLATYALCREFGVTRRRAVIGGLAVWLNPITFGLSYTFMTDVPFLALMIASVYAYVWAARRASLGGLVVGSALAGLAFLVRQQGVLIALAVFAWFLLKPPPWFRARPYRTALAMLGPCLLAVQEYYLWAWGNGLPSTQGAYLSDFRTVGWSGTLDLTMKIAVVGLFFAGLFLLPLTLGAIGEIPTAWARASITAKGAISVGLLCMVFWTRWYYIQNNGRSFPFIPWGSMIHEDGLGVLDSVGLRPFFWSHTIWLAIAILCALSAAGGAILIAGRERGAEPRYTWPRPLPPNGWLAGLVGAVAVGQFLGIIPPSLHITQFITFDRYYIPLLPLLVVLVLWAIRGHEFAPSIALGILAIIVVLDLLGTQDWFGFKQAQWDTAQWLVSTKGIPAQYVDGGPQWDGLHFYEYSLSHPNDRVPRNPGDVWWLWLIAPNIDPQYVVAASPPPSGYTLFAKRPYHSWVRRAHDAYIYVWQRDDVGSTVRALPPLEVRKVGPFSLPLPVLAADPTPTPTPTPANRYNPGDQAAGGAR